jgi:hypothetical protein
MRRSVSLESVSVGDAWGGGETRRPFFWRGVWARLAAARHIASGEARFSRPLFSLLLFLLCFFDTSS